MCEMDYYLYVLKQCESKDGLVFLSPILVGLDSYIRSNKTKDLGAAHYMANKNPRYIKKIMFFEIFPYPNFKLLEEK